ncbi:MAG: hypothetical protein PHH11_10605 [Methylomonas sp.]|nr:hypothetical protein [Methylomonas sp.]
MRVLVAIIAMYPLFAYAEVMDKEHSLLTISLWCVLGAVAAALAARFRPWLLLVVLPIIGLFFAGQLAEILDPYVGPAMAAEAGVFYVVVSWVAPVLVMVAGGIGFFFRSRYAKTNL